MGVRNPPTRLALLADLPALGEVSFRSEPIFHLPLEGRSIRRNVVETDRVGGSHA